MKVLIVTPYFWPHPGGVESYTLNIAKQLLREGWEVVVVTGSLAGAPSEETVQGIKVYRLKKAISVSNTPVGWRWRTQLKKIYAAEQPDIINGHVPVPYLADIAERCRGRIPFVLTYHNDLSKSRLPQKLITMFLNQTVIKRTLRRSDHIIATSQYYVETSDLLRRFADKVSIIPPGVDITLFNTMVVPTDIEEKYRGKRLILFVGSISMNQQHKGLDTLIKSFARLRTKSAYANTQLVVIGAGDGQTFYRKLATELDVNDYVEFTGFVENSLLAQYYKRASVFAMPSRDRSEAFGMVFTEAGAAGTPVIGTNVGGIPYAVKHMQTGLVIPPDDIQALRRALASLLSDEKLSSRLGAAAAERAINEFDWSRLGKQTANLFADVAKPPIIQIAGYYPPSIGGMERVAEAISELLAQRGYSVQVFTSAINQPQHAQQTHKPNLTIRRFRAIEFAHTTFAPGFIPALFRVPKRSVLHLHLSQAFYPEWTLIVAKLRRLPYVLHFHLDLQPSGPMGILFLPYKAVIIRTVIKHANAIIVFSPEQQVLLHTMYGVDTDKIVIIPNGVSSEYFADKPKRARKGTHSLLYVGRVSSQKRVGYLTGALALMHETAKLTIVGDGEERSMVQDSVPKDIATRVRFTGQLSPLDTLPYFRQADAFVMASKVEGMPLAILESMASGLPIVGADVPGIRELVSGVGILVKKPSPETFARSLDKLFSDDALYEKLSRNSRRAAERYSWPSLVERLERLYGDITRET